MRELTEDLPKLIDEPGVLVLSLAMILAPRAVRYAISSICGYKKMEM